MKKFVVIILIVLFFGMTVGVNTLSADDVKKDVKKVVKKKAACDKAKACSHDHKAHKHEKCDACKAGKKCTCEDGKKCDHKHKDHKKCDHKKKDCCSKTKTKKKK